MRYTPGDTLDEQFVVVDVLGAGGFGSALKVESLLDGRLYTLKVFLTGGAREQAERESPGAAVSPPSPTFSGLYGPAASVAASDPPKRADRRHLAT